MRDIGASAPAGLSNDDLLFATRALLVRSNEVIAQLIAHLAEIDARKLYLEQAQPSMFAWCVAELGCSEDVACNWIAVARVSRIYPAVLDALREGMVHLTGLRMLAPHLTEEGHLALLEEAAGRPKREIEELVARIAPRPAVPASIRKLPAPRVTGEENDNGDGDGRIEIPSVNGSVGAGAQSTAHLPAAPATGDGPEGSSLSATGEGGLQSITEPLSFDSAPRSAHRSQAPGRVEPLSDDAYKVTFTVSRRLRDKIRQAQDLLGHQVVGGDLAEIVERGLDLLMEDVRKRRFAAGRKPRPAKTSCDGEKKSTRAGKAPPATLLEAEQRLVEVSVAQGEERRSRYIPAEVRRAVHERDGERCTFVDERGRRCPATRRLELDHAEGFARGARHTVKGLRLRCRPHNQWAAERMYGRAFMEERRTSKPSAPGRIELIDGSYRDDVGRVVRPGAD